MWWVLPIYSIVYLALFFTLEKRITLDTPGIHIISCPIDAWIPFCEYFIVPYYFWFFFMFGTTTFFILFRHNRHEYYRYEAMMMIGMTVFLIISQLYPSGLMLRPETLPRDNYFTDLVIKLYRADTPTNVFPSMHVFNSVCACIAYYDCNRLKKVKWFRFLMLVITVSIVLSTMFLKQHSVIDVISALLLILILYLLIYVWGRKHVPCFR